MAAEDRTPADEELEDLEDLEATDEEASDVKGGASPTMGKRGDDLGNFSKI